MSLIFCSALLGALAGCGPPTTAPPLLLQRQGQATTNAPRADTTWPLMPAPEVARGFEAPPEPWAAGHRGVDLRGTSGQPVRAAHAGRVTFSGVVAGRGVVSIEHADGWRTTYEPLTDRVPVGAEVAAGSTIGTLTARASHCLPEACLHWGLLSDADVYRDPLTLVGGHREIVLLPLR